MVLIEETGHGPALLSEIRPQEGMRLFGIVPVDEKLERLRRHLPLIRGHRVAIPSSSLWREELLAELTEFPHGHFDDQVDALTQYLDWSTQNPPPPKRPNRPSIVGMGSCGRIVPPARGGSKDYAGARLRRGSFSVEVEVVSIARR